MEAGTERIWRPIEAGHPLVALQGSALGDYGLRCLLGPKNRFGALYFQVFLKAASGSLSRDPVLLGLFSSGLYPSYNWVEVIAYQPRFILDGEVDLRQGGLEEALFEKLAQIIPPGGHIMVEYEGPAWEGTARALGLGVPPPLTDLGYLLFQAGFRAGVKDWYIAEGGSEGPRKLQAYKALNRSHALASARRLARTLEAFLAGGGKGLAPELWVVARERARSLLQQLAQEFPRLHPQARP